MRGKGYLKYLNPLFYIRKRIAKKLEIQEWGELEQKGIDFVMLSDECMANHSRYQITRPQHLDFIKEYLEGRHISELDSVIDVGCGKGGILWVFSKYPFGHIAGLEYSEILCKICDENMKKLNVQADIINADANFFGDYDKYNYIYLYNPFQGNIMINFIDNLNESIRRNPREVHVIYTNPTCINEFLKRGYEVETEFATNVFFKEKAAVLVYKLKET